MHSLIYTLFPSIAIKALSDKLGTLRHFTDRLCTFKFNWIILFF